MSASPLEKVLPYICSTESHSQPILYKVENLQDGEFFQQNPDLPELKNLSRDIALELARAELGVTQKDKEVLKTIFQVIAIWSKEFIKEHEALFELDDSSALESAVQKINIYENLIILTVQNILEPIAQVFKKQPKYFQALSELLGDFTKDILANFDKQSESDAFLQANFFKSFVADHVLYDSNAQRTLVSIFRSPSQEMISFDYTAFEFFSNQDDLNEDQKMIFDNFGYVLQAIDLELQTQPLSEFKQFFEEILTGMFSMYVANHIDQYPDDTTRVLETIKSKVLNPLLKPLFKKNPENLTRFISDLVTNEVSGHVYKELENSSLSANHFGDLLPMSFTGFIMNDLSKKDPNDIFTPNPSRGFPPAFSDN